MYTQGSSDIVVAVIDSGIDFNHPDLVNQSWNNPEEIPGNGLDDDNNGYIDDIIGWDFRDNDNDPSPPEASSSQNPPPGHYHGTFIAGLIAADNDNDIIVGMAPNIRLMSIRFLDVNNIFYTIPNEWPMFIDAIDYAIKNGADVLHISISITTSNIPSTFHEAIKRAYDSGIAIVSVTGNYQPDVTYPGKYSEVIAVSATTRFREVASFSTSGDQNEICAPGENISSIYPGIFIPKNGSGTSYAAPLVTGTIALMLSLKSNLSIENIRTILHETSTDLGDIGKDPIFGYGLLNASSALKKVISDYN